MSADDDSGGGQREVAYRLFAAEYEDADFSFSESDEDRAPNYVITPTGARVNRLFVVGVLTEVEQVGEDVLRARVVDPTGAFVLYAGQYQPDEQAFLESASPPTFVAVTGKARTFQPEDSQQVFTSVRPESINEVDAETRDRWTVQAAEQTIARVGHAASALSTGLTGEQLRTTLVENGVDDEIAQGITLAFDHYETTPTYLDTVRDTALDAARVVAGDVDEVEGIDIGPDAAGDVTAADLADVSVDLAPASAANEQAVGDAGETTDAGEATDTLEHDTATATGNDQAGSSEPAAGTSETDKTVSTDPVDEAATQEPMSDSSPDVGTDVAGGSRSRSEESSGSETTTTGTDDDLGDFDAGDDLGDFDPEEDDVLEDDEREEIKEEYGTEFQSGTEVSDPGEADIETPDQTEPPAGEEEPAADTTDSEAEAAESEPDTSSGPETQTVTEQPAGEQTETQAESETETGADEEEVAGKETAETQAEPDDVEGALIEVMEELDDGSGANREALVAEMTDRYALADDEVEDAIEDALMGGKCYEPDDTSLKPI